METLPCESAPEVARLILLSPSDREINLTGGQLCLESSGVCYQRAASTIRRKPARLIQIATVRTFIQLPRRVRAES
jgi:hypothetical protein